MANFFKQLWARKVVQFGAIYLGAGAGKPNGAVASMATPGFKEIVDTRLSHEN